MNIFDISNSLTAFAKSPSASSDSKALFLSASLEEKVLLDYLSSPSSKLSNSDLPKSPNLNSSNLLPITPVAVNVNTSFYIRTIQLLNF